MNDWLAYFTNDGNSAVRETGKCRFEEDHIMMAAPNGILLLNGLILNKKELFDQYHTDRLDVLVNTMFVADPYQFFNQFRGPFTGMVYDRNHERGVVFTNQTGDSAVFYYLSQLVSMLTSCLGVKLFLLFRLVSLIQLVIPISSFMTQVFRSSLLT